MWMLILGGLIVGTLLGSIYLISRFARFSFVQKAAKGRKSICRITGLVLVILLFICTGALFGTINAEICFLHLVVVWLICDGVGRIAEKKLKKEFTKYYAGIAALCITTAYLACGCIWRIMYGALSIR